MQITLPVVKEAKTKNKKAIVLCRNYNGAKNILFLMNTDDERFNTANYKLVCYVTRYGKGVTGTLFSSESGKRFIVYSDWSAHQLG